MMISSEHFKQESIFDFSLGLYFVSADMDVDGGAGFA